MPMTVLRRLDSLLEPSQPAVLEMKTSLDKARIIHQDSALRQAAGQSFYNTSKFTLRDLKARASQQQLKADFEALCLLFIHPRAPNLISLRSAGTMLAGCLRLFALSSLPSRTPLQRRGALVHNSGQL